MGHRKKAMMEAWMPANGDPVSLPSHLFVGRILQPWGEDDRFVLADKDGERWGNGAWRKVDLVPLCLNCFRTREQHAKNLRCLFAPGTWEIRVGKKAAPKLIVHKARTRQDDYALCGYKSNFQYGRHGAGHVRDGCPSRYDWPQVTCKDCLELKKEKRHG